ncbi:O-linked N-acetylglucosamine transferase, SPINDLY family protein [Pararhodospirillum oryzae]|uniref:protein O-GlcNAc transferase n=1 Tax=Pararhodospirillum oryzae TaxID=478448 RepID=A0A512H7V7_9PROT|nr:tetratricopeptide repeat protein [Pararhodospirillum oryzae]GEO81535.1 hypothetical protein ROR02_16660 [Pararhodospirillum oryzae]
MSTTDDTTAEGWRLLEAGRLAEAEACFHAALKRAPENAAALGGLGHVALKSDRPDVAIPALESACRLDSRNESLRMALLQALSRAAARAPGDVTKAVALGRALAEAGDPTAARDAYVAALVAAPDHAESRWLVNRILPRVYPSVEDMARWRARFVAALRALDATVHPQDPEAAEQALQALMLRGNFELAYQGQNDRPVQETWGRLVARIMAARFPDLAHRPPALPLEGRGDRRLKIGYASSCFSSHTISLLFNGWIQHLDRSAFKPYLYVLGGQRDASTDTLLRMAEVGRDLRTAPLETAARTVRNDQLDLLVYPDLGMDPRVFALAGLRLAPVQCVSWGHPVTTGLPTLDWFLSSDAMEPEGADAFYSERLERLPRLSIAYTPTPARNEKDRAALGLPEGILFLCSQALQKYQPQHDAVFAAIARQIPDSRFIFILHKTQFMTNRHFKARLENAFRIAGLDPAAHLVFMPWMDWRDFLALNGACDVFLDSIGWSGGNTTLEALSRGLPPVTLPTTFMRGRHTYAMLSLMGMTELIAQDLNDYVRIAVRLGTDGAWRAAMKERLLQQHGRLYRDTDVVRALEAFYRKAHTLSLQESA